METLLGLGGVGGISGGGCGCQCEHCRCRQAGETPCSTCRPATSSSSSTIGTGVQTSKPSDVVAAIDLLNVTLKKIRRKESLGGVGGRNDPLLHPGEVLWGSSAPSSSPTLPGGRMPPPQGFPCGPNSVNALF
ncbi:unnamed protein product [Mesocestoides corti]|uniref:Uncharacterized protein n=1 Tax=Mesocestoides corti TaxID=53468 RepID=A0A0R3UNL1_MESCO|nr:unnamed protein product [Mesocestoides corti]